MKLTSIAVTTAPPAATSRGSTRSDRTPNSGWVIELLNHRLATSSASAPSPNPKRACRVGRSTASIELTASIAKWVVASNVTNATPPDSGPFAAGSWGASTRRSEDPCAAGWSVSLIGVSRCW